MNNTQRKALSNLKDRIDELKLDIEQLCDEE